MAEDATNNSAEYEDKAEAVKGGERDFVRAWVEALARADKEEEEWRKQAEKAIKTYRAKKESGGRSFNIFHSNVETLVPAVYNSTPVPDIRRRFPDPDKPSKTVADILERALSFSVDVYDFDGLMKRCIKDGEVVGRGVPRVRYVPTFDDKEQVTYEEVRCDYTPWRHFRRGPARTWDDMPWIAYEDFLTREQLRKLCGDKVDEQGKLIAEEVPLNYTASEKDDAKIASEEQGIFKRASVWQIWDKESRKVISICKDYKEGVLASVDDPLGLAEFYPTPRPYAPINTTDSLVPVVPYDIYQDLALELNEVTNRITNLVKQLRPRGGYGGNVHEIKAMAEAADGELVPLTGAEHLVQGSGLDKAISWFPLEPVVLALRQLVEQREAIKQTIFEVTGIADVMRGQTDSRETLGAQQLKAQWGALRIQDRQQEAARLARDLFRIKAEIIAEKFSIDTLQRMTGIPIPPQQQVQAAQMAMQQAMQMQQPPPPGAEEMAGMIPREAIEPILRSDVLRAYRIDIESDSTIRGDLARNQQAMTEFINGTAQYASAMGPLVQQMPPIMPFVLQLYGAFTRQFKLGRQAEDELEKLIEFASDPANQQPPADPEAEAKSAAEQEKIALEREKHEQQMGFEREKFSREQEQAQQSFQFEREKHDAEMAFQRENAVAEREARATEAEAGRDFERDAKNLPKRDQVAEFQQLLAGQLQTIEQALSAVNQSVAVVSEQIQQVSEYQQAPVSIERDKSGKATKVVKGDKVMEVKRGRDGRAVALH